MKKLVSLLLVVVMSLSLVACGDTVESILNQSENKAQMQQLSDMYQTTFGAECKIYAKGNDLYFDLTYPMEFTDEQVDQMGEALDAQMGGKIDEMKSSFEEQFKVKPGKITFNVIDANGDVVLEFGE